MKEENFIEAEAGTLWKIKDNFSAAIIPLWINPEADERIGFDAFWTDHGHFLKIGKIKTLIRGDRFTNFEKVVFFSKNRNEVATGYIMQSEWKFLRPYFREEDK